VQIDNIFIYEKDAAPETLTAYLKGRYENKDVNLIVTLPGKKHFYLAKWQKYRATHRVQVVDAQQGQYPSLNLIPKVSNRTTVYVVC
jgi:hypothetical protein